jgi:hypothetical protein
MLRKEDFAVIESLNKRGVYLKDIAAELEVHPRTVKRALREAEHRRENGKVSPLPNENLVSPPTAGREMYFPKLVFRQSR